MTALPDTLHDTPVLIIGGGPVGVSLAIDLAWRNTPSVIIERTNGVVTQPKASSATSRTAEFYRRWGISDRMRNSGFPQDYALNMVFCTSLLGHTLAMHEFPSMQDDPVPPQTPERKIRSPQTLTDPLLVETARATGLVTFHYETLFHAFTETDDGVAAKVEDKTTGEMREIACQYLVGCDGPGSRIRRQLGIAFEGKETLDYSVAIYLDVPDLKHHHDKHQAERYSLIGAQGTWGTFTAVNGDNLWRLTILGARSAPDMDSFDTDAWVRKALGSDKISYTVLSVKPWRRTQLVASSYGEGRVFICGDAAHTMSPTGGFGMNTGIGDATNLSWKLSAAVEGWAGPGLLSSYNEERRPVGLRNVNRASTNYRDITSQKDNPEIDADTPDGVATRERVGNGISKATRIQWKSLGVTMGYRYSESSICVDDGMPEPEDSPSDYVQTANPGHRAPHVWLAPGKSTIDHFGQGFVLLQFGRSAAPEPLADAARTRGVPFSVVPVDSAAAQALYERAYVLVRPDGHVGWRGNEMPSQPLAVIDTLRGA